MKKIQETINTQEKEKTPERGANIVFTIKLIRHPEKEYKTGDLTKRGKQEFIKMIEEELKEEEKEGKRPDTLKFYLSPHKRPQQLRDIIAKFLEENGYKTKTRDKEELLGGLDKINPEAITILQQ